jgi:nitroimidazol reductase NimA-like FMN-containing flavoprotein (pyridoxamine 5'-phosphate oxidase superfamily)
VPVRDLTREQVDELLHEQFVARIGCQADGELFVVPIIYAYDGEAFYVASQRAAGPGTVCFRIVLDEVTGRAVER